MSDFPIQIPSFPVFPPLPVSPPPSVGGDVASGQAGLNAYQLAVIGASGAPPFVGDMAAWLESLRGEAAAVATDPALGISDSLAPSQAAVKTYVDVETSRATQTEESLGAAINQEGLDRVSALSAMQDSIDTLTSLLAEDDVSLDELHEIVAYIKANRADLDALGIGSVIGLEAELSSIAGSVLAEVARATAAEGAVSQAANDAAGLAGDALALAESVAGGLGTISPKNYTQSETAPENPNPGDQWLRTTSGQKFEFYTGFWVEIGSGALTAEALQTVINNGNYTFGGKLTAAGQGAPAALTNADVLTSALLIGNYAELGADQVMNLSTVSVDIAGMSVTLPVGVYHLTSCVMTSPANSTMGQKIVFTSSGGATGTVFGTNTFTNNNLISQVVPYQKSLISVFVAGEIRQIAGGANSQGAQSRHELIVRVTAGAATFKYAFAQHTSNASNLTALAGSFIRAQKIG